METQPPQLLGISFASCFQLLSGVGRSNFHVQAQMEMIQDLVGLNIWERQRRSWLSRWCAFGGTAPCIWYRLELLLHSLLHREAFSLDWLCLCFWVRHVRGERFWSPIRPVTEHLSSHSLRLLLVHSLFHKCRFVVVQYFGSMLMCFFQALITPAINLRILQQQVLNKYRSLLADSVSPSLTLINGARRPHQLGKNDDLGAGEGLTLCKSCDGEQPAMTVEVLLESFHQVRSLALGRAAIDPNVSATADPLFQHVF
mmetsp:Transcript_64613/g.131339  ORF Transcript_64613/g.131339 Transcript_64613/m.131339 type:complete len:256 (-) Transcript_64613:408-1175(-)